MRRMTTSASAESVSVAATAIVSTIARVVDSAVAAWTRRYPPKHPPRLLATHCGAMPSARYA
jgi:hypothetical protein